MTYQILRSDSINDLEKQVTALMKPRLGSTVRVERWEPTGGVSVGANVYTQHNPVNDRVETMTEIMYYQSMVMKA